MKKVIVFAVLIGAIGFAAPAATADLVFGDPITVNGFAGPEFGSTFWGTIAPLGLVDNGLPHLFGGLSLYADAFFPSATVTVTSFLLPPPPGKKFAGEIVIDFSAFFPGDFTFHNVDILGIKDPFDPAGFNFINDVLVTGGPGTVSTDGFGIFWSGLGADLALSPVVSIFWTQIPAPGSLALLGLAGLFGGRRRRRA